MLENATLAHITLAVAIQMFGFEDEDNLLICTLAMVFLGESLLCLVSFPILTQDPRAVAVSAVLFYFVLGWQKEDLFALNWFEV